MCVCVCVCIYIYIYIYIYCVILISSRSSVVGVATRLLTGRSGVRMLVRAIFFFSPERAPGPTQPPVQWVPGFFTAVTRPGREVNHSPQCSAEIKNEWSFALFPLYTVVGNLTVTQISFCPVLL
jgi:hypothetical protein